jgi:hypothetical protein
MTIYLQQVISTLFTNTVDRLTDISSLQYQHFRHHRRSDAVFVAHGCLYAEILGSATCGMFIVIYYFFNNSY